MNCGFGWLEGALKLSQPTTDPYIGDPRSVETMRNMDTRMNPAWREMVHEYGFVIIAKLLDEGYHNAELARAELETWRERRQEQWMRTDYITPAMKDNLMAAVRSPWRRKRRPSDVPCRHGDGKPRSAK